MRISIKHKLFFTLLLTSSTVVVCMFFFMQWSFDRGFLDYVNIQELDRLNELVDTLAEAYADEGDWRFLEGNHELWGQYTGPEQDSPRQRSREGGVDRNRGDNRRPPPPRNDGFGPRPERLDPEESQGDVRPRAQKPRDRVENGQSPPPPNLDHPPVDGRQIGPRVMLFDAEKRWIIGGHPIEIQKLKLRPVTYQDQTVGYIGLLPTRELADAGDLLFVEQQTEAFALIALAMIAVSLVLGFPLINHLLVPIRALTRGTSQLTAGQYRLRLPVKTQDELGQLSRDFNILAMTLDKNEKARQQWVADISHELRTPLAVLRGEIEAIQDGVRQATPQALEALHGEVLHLTRLVGDLYELSTSDIGALSYKKIRVDPVGVLEGVVELFSPRLAKKRITLHAKLPTGATATLLADPDRLQQLYTNLLENCLRYTDPNGQVEIRLERSRKSIVFHFQDSAPAVPNEQLPRLFDHLFRVDASRNRASGGSGIGMAICKNIVEAHQGRIEASPSPLGGLWIRVEFPLEVTGISNQKEEP